MGVCVRARQRINWTGNSAEIRRGAAYHFISRLRSSRLSTKIGTRYCLQLLMGRVCVCAPLITTHAHNLHTDGLKMTELVVYYCLRITNCTELHSRFGELTRMRIIPTTHTHTHTPTSIARHTRAHAHSLNNRHRRGAGVAANPPNDRSRLNNEHTHMRNDTHL